MSSNSLIHTSHSPKSCGASKVWVRLSRFGDKKGRILARLSDSIWTGCSEIDRSMKAPEERRTGEMRKFDLRCYDAFARVKIGETRRENTRLRRWKDSFQPGAPFLFFLAPTSKHMSVSPIGVYFSKWFVDLVIELWFMDWLSILCFCFLSPVPVVIGQAPSVTEKIKIFLFSLEVWHILARRICEIVREEKKFLKSSNQKILDFFPISLLQNHRKLQANSSLK